MRIDPPLDEPSHAVKVTITNLDGVVLESLVIQEFHPTRTKRETVQRIVNLIDADMYLFNS
jgi:hypothetical protein